MIFLLNMVRLNVYPVQAVVKVDDTTGGDRGGSYAGCWTVGIAKTGNYAGMTEKEMESATRRSQGEGREGSRLYPQGWSALLRDRDDERPAAILADINTSVSSQGLKP